MKANPYLAGLKFVQKSHGTSAQVALAKLILSLYNPVHAFSLSDVLWPLDDKNSMFDLAREKRIP